MDQITTGGARIRSTGHGNQDSKRGRSGGATRTISWNTVCFRCGREGTMRSIAIKSGLVLEPFLEIPEVDRSFWSD